MAQEPGYPIAADWPTLCNSFFTRLYGTKQVTDAYLLGLALREGLVLVAMDKAICTLPEMSTASTSCCWKKNDRRQFPGPST
jgi:hypothetical protein